MVKVREFCCGCSLRSGTFTVAWSLMIYSALFLIGNIYVFLSKRRLYEDFKKYTNLAYAFPSAYIFAYQVIRTIVGIAVSVTALWALHKNKLIFLNGLYWYLCYTTASFIISEIFLIFEPSWERILIETNPILLQFYTHDEIESILMFLIIYLFMAGIVAYFALIVKSYKDYGLRNEAQNVQFVGPDATTVGYIAA